MRNARILKQNCGNIDAIYRVPLIDKEYHLKRTEPKEFLGNRMAFARMYHRVWYQLTGRTSIR